jgi:hypothetical protein
VVDAVPAAAVLAIAAVALFDIAAVRAAPRPAKVVGLQQLFIGLAVVAITATAVRV